MLNKVLLSADVALVCTQHALSTEKEEIMGLLLGEIQITCFQSINEGSSQSRKEIEMELVNNNNTLLENNFKILTQLPAILKEEEDEAYNNEVGQQESDDIISKQHNAAVRTIAIGHIVEKMSRPMLEALVARNALNNMRLKALKKQHQFLMSRLEEMPRNF